MTFFCFVIKYFGICKDIAETKQMYFVRSEREMVKALVKRTASHFLRCPG